MTDEAPLRLRNTTQITGRYTYEGMEYVLPEDIGP